MSRINDLIKEMCPNGVEYLELYKVVKWNKKFSGVNNDWQNEIFTTKSNISAQELKSLLFEDGNIKLLSTGNFDGYTSSTVYDGSVDDYEIITIPSGGTANIKYYNGKFINSGNILGTTIDKNKYNLKYVYYCLINKKNLIQSFFRGSSVQHPDMKQIIQITIPIPPIEVQVEMVRILDKFGELEAELEARKSQYEFWREKLLSNNNRQVCISDIVDISRGKRVVKKDLEMYSCNLNPVFQNSLAPLGYYSDYNCEGDTTYIITAGAAGDIGYSYSRFWAADDCLVCKSCNEIDSKYLYYYLINNQSYIKSYVRKASVPRLSKNVIEKMKICLPTLDEQKKIVDTLDKFNKLINDIIVGLPAEIELRRKQYEYYRNKLLSFEKLYYE